MTPSKRDRLEAAYRKLPIRPNEVCMIPAMLDVLEQLPPTAEPLPAFTVVGRQATQRELDRLEAAARALVECLSSLHEPAITALADAKADNRPVGFWDRAALMRMATHVAIAARRADVSEVPEKQGTERHSTHVPLAIAHILASDYQTLTGNNPTCSSDKNSGLEYLSFPDFVEEVFRVLGVNEDPEWMARRALELRRSLRE